MKSLLSIGVAEDEPECDEQHRETINLAAHTLAGMSGMSERQAVRRLEQLASQEQRSVSEVAETILGAATVSEADSED